MKLKQSRWRKETPRRTKNKGMNSRRGPGRICVPQVRHAYPLHHCFPGQGNNFSFPPGRFRENHVFRKILTPGAPNVFHSEACINELHTTACWYCLPLSPGPLRAARFLLTINVQLYPEATGSACYREQEERLSTSLRCTSPCITAPTSARHEPITPGRSIGRNPYDDRFAVVHPPAGLRTKPTRPRHERNRFLDVTATLPSRLWNTDGLSRSTPTRSRHGGTSISSRTRTATATPFDERFIPGHAILAGQWRSPPGRGSGVHGRHRPRRTCGSPSNARKGSQRPQRQGGFFCYPRTDTRTQMSFSGFSGAGPVPRAKNAFRLKNRATATERRCIRI
jgi:hypothetical protein